MTECACNVFPESLGNITFGAGVVTPFGGLGRYENLLQQSEALDQSPWQNYGDSVTVNADAATAPDGTTSADEIVSSTPEWGRYQNFSISGATAGRTFTLSVWLKGSGASGNVRLYVVERGGASGAQDSSTIVSVSSTEWRRFTVTHTVIQNDRTTIESRIATQSGLNAFYVWGAQLEEKATPGVYVRTGTTPVTAAGKGLVVDAVGPHVFLRGNLGIGIASPAYRLHTVGGGGIQIEGDATTPGVVLFMRPGSNFQNAITAIRFFDINGVSKGSIIAFPNLATPKLGLSSSGKMDFTVNNTTTITLDTNGNVGIGTTTPGALLDVAGAARATQFADRDNPAYYLDPAGATSLVAAGNVAIGDTDALGYRLRVVGGPIRLEGATTITTSGLVVQAGGIRGNTSDALPIGVDHMLNGTVRVRNASSVRYRSDLGVDATGATLVAYDDGAVPPAYLPIYLQGVQIELRPSADPAKAVVVEASGRLVVKAGGATITGAVQVNSGGVTAPSFTGDGAGLNNVNAAKLGGRLPSEYIDTSGTGQTKTGPLTAQSFSGDGAGLTNVDAALLGGRLPSGYIDTSGAGQTKAGDLGVESLTVGGSIFADSRKVADAAGCYYAD